METKKIAVALLSVFTLTAAAQKEKPVYLDPSAPIEARVQDALSRMTVHEKVQILHAQSKFTSAGVPRLGIRQLNHSDGPHGVRAEVAWNSWNTAGWTNDSIVVFPSLTCLAATWNRSLAIAYGNAISEEFAFRGKDILLGPGVTIARTPLNGRNFEYMGEDPYLAGELALEYVKAAQKNGVACCLKHFALNNQETDRMTVNVNIGERALREIYLPAFKKCVQKGGLWTIMGAYNRWNNVHMCQNDSLLNKILKREWGFDGAVVSDWGGVNDTWQAATGGMDLEMGSFTNGKTEDRSLGFHTYNLADPFESLVKEGKIPMETLNDKAARVLRTIFRTSMNANKAIGSQCSEAHYDVCRRVGEEGIVLLKNRKNILPIRPGQYRHILVVGENAIRNQSEGGGSSELKPLKDVSPLEAIRKAYGADVEFAQGYYAGKPMYNKVEKLDPDSLKRLKDKALEKAKKADLIIFIGGLNKNTKQDCEDNDRESYELGYGQNELIADLAKVQANIVVVTYGGNAFATPWVDSVKGFVHCWYLGSMSGTALANVLTGEVNPSGKLPVTFAKKLDDYGFAKYGRRAYPGVDRQVYYDEGIYVGYRWFDTKGVKPQFPFGYGLSYTTFKYGKATVSSPAMTKDGSVKVSMPITNTGKIDGKEVVQLYISDLKSSEDRPAKELKNFKKVSLKAGETKTVTFNIRPEALQFWSTKTHSFILEPGKFKAHFCASETDVKSSVEFEVK